MDSITQTFRAKLFAGVATLLPLYLTYVVIRFLFESLEEMSGPILERFGLGIPGLGIILTIILIYLLGIIVTNFLGRKIFNLGESIVKRVPIVSMIYTTLKQITDTFTKGTTDAFDGVVYIQYPRQGLWTMAFISGKSKNKDDVPYFHLFVPTTLINVPAEAVAPSIIVIISTLQDVIISIAVNASKTEPPNELICFVISETEA